MIADSTGIVVDGMYFQTLIGYKYKKRRFYDKLNVLAEYYPHHKAIVVSDADSLFSSDAFSAKIMLSEIKTKAGKFFADAAYDSDELFENLFKNNIIPIVKIRKHSNKLKRFRKIASEIFNEKEYKKYRSIIEGIFGGLETRRLLFTRYKKKNQ